MNLNNRLTTNQGAPVGDNQNSRTAGRRGPVVLEDYHLIEKLAHFDRERIPERVVHARGAGAHGVFVTKHSMKEYTKSDIFTKRRNRNACIRSFLNSYSRPRFSRNST